MKVGIPHAGAVFFLAVSFGVAAEPVLGALAAVVMSVVVNAGSAQFAATAVLADGGGVVTAIVAGALLNLRFGVMGIALSASLTGSARRRAAISQAIVDFSWSVANRADGRIEPARMVGAMAPVYAAWVVGTATGVLVGDRIPDPRSLGLDVIFPALFLALLWDLAADDRSCRGAAAIGAITALLLLPVAPPGVPLILAPAAAVLVMTGRRAGLRRGRQDRKSLP